MQIDDTFNPHIPRVMAIPLEHIDYILDLAQSNGAMYSSRLRREPDGHVYYLVTFHGDRLLRAAQALNKRRSGEKAAWPGESYSSVNHA